VTWLRTTREQRALDAIDRLLDVSSDKAGRDEPNEAECRAFEAACDANFDGEHGHALALAQSALRPAGAL
jgi:hypothetical protein